MRKMNVDRRFSFKLSDNLLVLKKTFGTQGDAMQILHIREHVQI